MSQPTFGHTRLGQAVHATTSDFHKAGTSAQRFNKRAAVAITSVVGSMWTAYLFALLAIASLPAVLSGFQRFHSTFPHWMVSASVIALVAWVAQTFLQLVLLPVIIVGQNVQAEASDARAAKTFEDVERILDALDTHTQGGLGEVLAAIEQLKEQQAR